MRWYDNERQRTEGALFTEISDANGDRLAPVAMVLETYCRNPKGKHRRLELFAQHGIELADTPPMAVHRGRIDLLSAGTPRCAEPQLNRLSIRKHTYFIFS